MIFEVYFEINSDALVWKPQGYRKITLRMPEAVHYLWTNLLIFYMFFVYNIGSVEKFLSQSHSQTAKWIIISILS